MRRGRDGQEGSCAGLLPVLKAVTLCCTHGACEHLLKLKGKKSLVIFFCIFKQQSLFSCHAGNVFTECSVGGRYRGSPWCGGSRADPLCSRQFDRTIRRSKQPVSRERLDHVGNTLVVHTACSCSSLSSPATPCKPCLTLCSCQTASPCLGLFGCPRHSEAVGSL